MEVRLGVRVAIGETNLLRENPLMGSSIFNFFTNFRWDKYLRALLLVSLNLSILQSTSILEAQIDGDPFEDPFAESTPDGIFGVDPFAENIQNPQDTQVDSGSISIAKSGRIRILGPGGVPDLSILPSLRLDFLHSSEGSPDPDVSTTKSEIRFEGNLLKENSFLVRFDLAGNKSTGVISELWLDRAFGSGLHLTAGRLPITMGLESFPGQEKRITITPGLLDWLGGGSAWGVRSGGSWVNHSLTGDIQLSLGDNVDVGGKDFGGYGLLTRFTMRPFSRYLFGGPAEAGELLEGFSFFVTGRWDHNAKGKLQINSAGDVSLYRSTDLEMENANWVRTGWRLPITDFFHIENEWNRTSLYGVGDDKTDMPGEITGFQFSFRLRLGSETPLPVSIPLDLPGQISDTSPKDQKEDFPVDLLLRYEQLSPKERLLNEGLLETEHDLSDLRSLRLVLSKQQTQSIRWILESAWTRNNSPINLSGNLGQAEDIFSFRCLMEIGL